MIVGVPVLVEVILLVTVDVDDALTVTVGRLTETVELVEAVDELDWLFDIVVVADAVEEADSVPVTVAVDERELIIDGNDASADAVGCAEPDREPCIDADQTDETEFDADGVAVVDPEALVVLLLVAVATGDISFCMVADADEHVVTVGEVDTVDDSDAFDVCDAVAELLPDVVDVMETVALVDAVVVAEEELDCEVVTVAVDVDDRVFRAFEQLPVVEELNVTVFELVEEPELVCEAVADTVDDMETVTVIVAVIEEELETDLDLLGDIVTEPVAVVVCACTLNNSAIKIIDRIWDCARRADRGLR